MEKFAGKHNFSNQENRSQTGGDGIRISKSPDRKNPGTCLIKKVSCGRRNGCTQ